MMTQDKKIMCFNPFAFDELGLNGLDLEVAKYIFYPLNNFYDKYGNYVDDKGIYHDQDDELVQNRTIVNGPCWYYDDWRWYLEEPKQYFMMLDRTSFEEEQIETLESMPEEAMQQYGYHNMNYLHQILPSLK